MFTRSGGGCDKRVIALQDARELTVILRHCGADDFRHIGVQFDQRSWSRLIPDS